MSTTSRFVIAIVVGVFTATLLLVFLPAILDNGFLYDRYCREAAEISCAQPILTFM